jgi:hypothetical protein
MSRLVTFMGRLGPWDVLCRGTFCAMGMFCAVGHLEMGRFESWTFCAVGRLVP